ncbi:hypothetical protein F441_20628 [Phytophthora nicotianae CJ01A1]|uniref:Uncharacterized protein n=3 Tax=Phytophthora nicotianae TaxID=4792 RepID=V9DTG8_PHYNI|nr:hypothetical protein F443_22683 [Phytophthora nicotianae P1569]ETK75683.1 hypothetical protein L915_17745 [Phytophthora nicotianae]ETL29115.1 hypothetical protein L916_17645 [Phytophthora nicotianae]ETL82339.1 hypothetical protein L917_17484 [Phytophthora nicotianae]ETP02283.1 hypothetical protein F441_20628 [Phytophthora nicotianae CJ01A1]
MIFALQPETKLRVYAGCFDVRDDTKSTVVNVPVGFCVLFRGDLIHNGMPYNETNYRHHCYPSNEGIVWTLDVVQDTLPKHSTCKYCDVKMEKWPHSTSTSTSSSSTLRDKLTSARWKEREGYDLQKPMIEGATLRNAKIGRLLECQTLAYRWVVELPLQVE